MCALHQPAAGPCSPGRRAGNMASRLLTWGLDGWGCHPLASLASSCLPVPGPHPGRWCQNPTSFPSGASFGQEDAGFCFHTWVLPTNILGGYSLSVFPLHRHDLSRYSQEMVRLTCQLYLNGLHTPPQHATYIEKSENSSFLPPRLPWSLNAGRQSWQQAPLATRFSHQPQT